MIKTCCFLSILFLISSTAFTQKPVTDSSKFLDEVTITAFGQNKTINNSSVAVRVLQSNNADRVNKTSLVNGFNSIAGVRMEERSPGSYRINIRGSSLRSPFGVRNVKVYWNDIPFTDPGGNTYFNQIAFNNFNNIEIFKGPAGSMYGAGTGGLLIINSFGNSWHPKTTEELVVGSNNLVNALATIQFGNSNNKNSIAISTTRSNGYRDNSAMERKNILWNSQLKISERQTITTLLNYTNLYYQTPGGLNATEFAANPKQARPAAGGFPSAAVAKAAIYQKNLLVGITSTYQFNTAFKNTTAVYAAYAQIKNPTFRNYERRSEPHYGGRSSFSYTKKTKQTTVTIITGIEWQQGYFNTQVSKNKNGNPDTLQTNDDINSNVVTGFIQTDINIGDSWLLNAGASINKSSIEITRLNKYPVVAQKRTYQNEWAPRISMVKKFTSELDVFASVAKGFSPPTIAEVLPSTGVISTFLEAEYGINYETGLRKSFFNKQLRIEATAYYFKIKNALVLRKDNTNADYFANAGNTNQKGFELSVDYFKALHSAIIKNIVIRGAYTYNYFIYGDYQKDNTSFKNKLLPGVPKNTISLLADIDFAKDFYANTTYYYASSNWLNDANTASAKAYHLMAARIGWQHRFKKWQLNLYTGADNIFNETYSLGNDINAAGGRYYNAAPKRNYYAGIQLQQYYKK
ncbi:MAG: TonB-dependent receptor [Sphingobacteriales bacterium]|nr:MAG: TonB-dependent receptor [Sphingobacteriales bacterium]